MEKIVDIGGKEVRLKASAMTPVIYRNAFGRDIFKAQGSIFTLASKKLKDLANVDSVGVMEIVWAMAKTADRSLPGFEDWLETLEAFPILDVFNETVDLLMQNMTVRSNIKNSGAAES